jgi:hypothetical protein
MLPTTSPARLNAIAVSDARGVGARDFCGWIGRTNGANLCKGLWLLKKSLFFKTAKIGGIENV